MKLWEAAYWVLRDAPEGLHLSTIWRNIERRGFADSRAVVPTQSLSTELQRRAVGSTLETAAPGIRHFERAGPNHWTLSEQGRLHPPHRGHEQPGGAGGGASTGRMSDAARRRAVEERAMELATAHYERASWKVEDTSAVASHDLLCTRLGERLCVEVKGTTGDGSQVIVTFGEVEHARRHHTALFVVANIAVEEEEGRPIARGGDAPMIVDPWRPDDDVLRPISYYHQVNGGST